MLVQMLVQIFCIRLHSSVENLNLKGRRITKSYWINLTYFKPGRVAHCASNANQKVLGSNVFGWALRPNFVTRLPVNFMSNKLKSQGLITLGKWVYFSPEALSWPWGSQIANKKRSWAMCQKAIFLNMMIMFN